MPASSTGSPAPGKRRLAPAPPKSGRGSAGCNAKQTYSDYELTSTNAAPYISIDSAGRFDPARMQRAGLTYETP